MWPFSRKKKELSSKELRDRFKKQGEWAIGLIADFGAYIEDTDLGLDIRDVSKLPWPKEDLIRAFTFGLSIESDSDLREGMKVLLISLSQFQSNVGAVDLSLMPKLNAPVDKLSPEQVMAAMTANEPIYQAYQRLLPKVEADRAALFVIAENTSSLI